jgi:putative photosynthetic complex assembly protein 2
MPLCFASPLDLFGALSCAPAQAYAAAIFALLSWWLSTGIILLLVRLPKRSFKYSLLAWSALFVPAMWLGYQSMQENTVVSAYSGFVSVLVMWGWHELAFLSGWVCGPRKTALSARATGYQRFKESIEAILYHELGLIFNLLVLIAIQGSKPNHVVICTYALLWLMRLSAKLNLYFGVPQVGDQYLPEHLKYLGSYFKKARLSRFFVLSLFASSLSWAWIVWQASTGQVELTTAWVLLATLLGLGIVEHLVMISPVSIERLWGWAMHERVDLFKNLSNSDQLLARPVPNLTGFESLNHAEALESMNSLSEPKSTAHLSPTLLNQTLISPARLGPSFASLSGALSSHVNSPTQCAAPAVLSQTG